MRIRRLYLQAFGPFTDRVLDFGAEPATLVVVHGRNEAGKSSALRAISDLRFGIPPQSSDDFLHSHPDMRVGGEFIGHDGQGYSLVRRKGRSPTLYLADFAHPEAPAATPASPEIEGLLTCGLTKQQHDMMFGIDHETLREGGEALLSGEGEVGAALFEASAGIRSVPAILEQLDQSARKYFMPGARGRNAKINEALAAFQLHQSAVKQAQVKPAAWNDLDRRQEDAAAEVERLETRWQELHASLVLLGELRAVAPLLSTLDAAGQVLDELRDAPILSLTAAEERAAAEAGLADAQHNATLARSEIDAQSGVLTTVVEDEAILSIDSMVKRFIAAAESASRYEGDRGNAEMTISELEATLSRLAQGISPGLSLDSVISGSPGKARRAEIESLLRASEEAKRAVQQHETMAPRQADTVQERHVDSITKDARVMLRMALLQVTRSEAELQRLSALPAEIKVAQRAAELALAAANLRDEPEFRNLRPLLDAQIDSCLTMTNKHEGLIESNKRRIDEINTAIRTTEELHTRLSAEGSVPTRSDVLEARRAREAMWSRIRGEYIDHPLSHADVQPASTRTGPASYEASVQTADRVVDALASDTQRASELQQCRDTISALLRDRATLAAEVELTGAELASQSSVWAALVKAAYLPTLAPAALREWQRLLPVVQRALENWRAKDDERLQLLQKETQLLLLLREALIAAGILEADEERDLNSLIVAGEEIERECKEHDAAIERATGETQERQRQAQQWSIKKAELAAAAELAARLLEPIYSALWLPAESSEIGVRVRLAELEEIAGLNAEKITCESTRARAQKALEELSARAANVATLLKDEPPGDLSLYAERLTRRLDEAERAHAMKTRAAQRVESAQHSLADHLATARRHHERLDKLCVAAGVLAAHELPQSELDSQRKRGAQATVDISNGQLANASKRKINELRELLANREFAKMDSETNSLTQAQTQTESALALARQTEEKARAELNAIDGSDAASVAREALERAAAGVRGNMGPWIRGKIAHSILAEALRRFRDRAQGPMLVAATTYFAKMTGGRFIRLVSEDSEKAAVLVAVRTDGTRIRVEAMSEGTRDQLYLALRLAALDFRRTAGVDLPLILDDVLITSDEERVAAILDALTEAAQSHQVMVFTHHQHIVDIATRRAGAAHIVSLQ
jgi:DNA repair protein SbcC/Rad50